MFITFPWVSQQRRSSIKGFKPANQILDETKETWREKEIPYLTLLTLHLEINELLESRDGIHAH